MKKLLLGLLALGSFSTYAQMTQVEMKEFLLGNRAVFENYKVGNQFITKRSGLTTCDGQLKEFKQTVKETIIKIVGSKAYFLEENNSEYCGGIDKNNTSSIMLKDLNLLTYKAMSEDFSLPGLDLENFTKISNHILAYEDRDKSTSMRIDFSVPGVLVSGKIDSNVYKEVWERTFTEFVDPQTFDVKGLKIIVEIPLDDESIRLEPTDLEMKDLE